MESDVKTPEAGWPLRTWTLAVLAALTCLAIQQLSDLPDRNWDWGRRLVSATIMLLGIGGLTFGLSWLRGRTVSAAIMALLCGVVTGAVFLWNGMPNANGYDPFFMFWSWNLLCGLVAPGIALTLFQAAQRRHPALPERWSLAGLRDWKHKALDYADVHEAMWVDALLLGAALIFTGIAFAVAHLIAEMFWLVKIDLLRELLRKNWFNALLVGAAFGGAMGLLRDRTIIIAALQKVARIVLRVLAPVLGAGLVGFLSVLPFTGLAPLWATGNTTPLMLGAAVMALFLVNAVVGDREEARTIARPFRWAAMALGLAMLPLVIIAAYSSGLRIAQHGFSPDRLWALTFIILGTITAIAYAVAILRRGDWIASLHRSNLHLCFILGGVALLLSTSLISFERISTSNQLARLASGRVSAVDFDYRGLWYHFGPPGRDAIRKLAKSAPRADVRRFAAAATRSESVYGELPNEVAKRSGDALDRRLTVLPQPVSLEPKLRDLLSTYEVCGEDGKCLLRFMPGNRRAIVLKAPQAECKQCGDKLVFVYRNTDGSWDSKGLVEPYESSDPRNRAKVAPLIQAAREGKLELRTVERQQLFIDGKPMGDSIQMESAAKP